MSGFSFNEAAFAALVNDPSGPVAREVGRVAYTQILPAARETLSRPYHGQRNPAPGPPLRRSGDLVESLKVVEINNGFGIEFDVIAEAVHRGFPYPQHLRDQGYIFLDPQVLAALNTRG